MEDDILECIRSDLPAADLKFSLFYAALNSYRFDSVLNPHPVVLMNSLSKEEDVKNIRNIAKNIPKLQKLVNNESKTLAPETDDLLRWLFCTQNSPHVKKLTNSESSNIQLLSQQDKKTKQPNFVFEVCYNDVQENQFQERRGGRKLLCGFHGSRIENFHSILHHGLKGHLNKKSLFGTGTYLSSELSISLIYSPSGETWKNSSLGPSLSCVAVCEIIDDPDVKCHTESPSEYTANRAKDTEAGDIPEKYYLVTNNDLMRVKYLLVYVMKPPISKKDTEKNWIQRNKFLLFMLSYVIILAAIGLGKSPSFRKLFR